MGFFNPWGILKLLLSPKVLMLVHYQIPACVIDPKPAMKKIALCLLLLAFCFLLSSCAGSNRVRSVDETGLQQLIQQARGKVVLLNFWATWCEPCKEEFPALVKIARQFQPRGLQIIFVSIDEPEDIESKVLPFLKAEGVAFRTYIKRTKDDETFINAIDVKWSGAIPATFIYDTSGALVQRLVAQQSYETFAEAVQPLLPKSPSTENSKD